MQLAKRIIGTLILSIFIFSLVYKLLNSIAPGVDDSMIIFLVIIVLGFILLGVNRILKE